MSTTNPLYTLGIDIGSTTVKIAILDENHTILFSDYKRHFANIQETLSDLLSDAYRKLGNLTLHPMITGSGGLTLANHLGVPFVQEVIAVSTCLYTHLDVYKRQSLFVPNLHFSLFRRAGPSRIPPFKKWLNTCQYWPDVVLSISSFMEIINS